MSGKNHHNRIHSQYTKFIIAGLPRTGTNFLQTLLDSHPAIVSLGEIFNPLSPLNETTCNYALFPHQEGMSDADELRSSDPVNFIEKYIFKQYAPDISAVGFKVSGADWRVWKYLNMDPDLKVIRVARKNWLQMLASFKIARKTGAWTNKCSRKTSIDEEKSVVLEYQECLQCFNYWYQWEQLTKKIFSGHAELRVLYDDLTEYRETATRTALKFLGVNYRKLFSDLEKQNPEPLSELVRNYGELKTRFADSRWSLFFTD